MEQNKYWIIIAILETLFLILIIEVAKDLVNHGMFLLGNGLRLLGLLILFYRIGKGINDLMK